MNREDLPKPNATCVVCGRKYYRCGKCIELRHRGIEAWKLNCDTFNCFSVHCLLENAKKGNFNSDMYRELISIELADNRIFSENVAKQIVELAEIYDATKNQENVCDESKVAELNDCEAEMYPVVEDLIAVKETKKKYSNKKPKNVK